MGSLKPHVDHLNFMAHSREITNHQSYVRPSGKEKQDTGGYFMQMKKNVEKKYITVFIYHFFGK